MLAIINHLAFEAPQQRYDSDITRNGDFQEVGLIAEGTNRHFVIKNVDVGRKSSFLIYSS